MTDVDHQALDQRLRPFERTAWLPEVVDEDLLPAGSKFSGIPVLGPGEQWPPCGNCGRPMQLFVQLDAADLPEEFAARLLGGLVQLFYCMRDDPFCASDCEAWAHHSRSTLVRLLPRELADQRQRVVDPAPDMFPPQRVVGWTAVLDLPGSDELEELGVNLTDQECEALWQRRRVPHDGSKLGGWPLWVQHVEYPNCRLCGRRMEMLFQLDAEDPVAYLFAAGGVGHITQCATHRAEVAFGWACG